LKNRQIIAQKIGVNRKIPPPVHQITSLSLPNPVVSYLDNGIPVYQILMGTQDIMKIEIVVNVGRFQEDKKLVARATPRLLREGTASFSSTQIAEQLDFYAGTLQTPVSMDTANIMLYCMTKHFESLVPILAEILWQPRFPEKEMNVWVENNIQRLIVDLTKNDVIAYRKITEMIFGEQTPYGYSSSPEDYRALTPDDLRQFHHDYFRAENMSIILSGKFDDKITGLLNQYLGQYKPSHPKKELRNPISFGEALSPTKPYKLLVPNADSSQKAIRLGRRIIGRKHPDFHGFFVLNTILGGYFGSRLMSNIREDKGFTYNVYSSSDVMMHDAYFYISSEVGNKFVDKALKEIYKEMDRLQNDLVGEEELQMVRNYLLGNMLNMVDGPFAVSEVVKIYIMDNLPISTLNKLTETICHISPETIRDLAQRYFQRADMFEVVVG
jgi:predicted Zn-dependent peptidase